MIPSNLIKPMLLAHAYGNLKSTCEKRQIGSVIPIGESLIFGANKANNVWDCCKPRELCDAQHSEVDAINNIPTDLLGLETSMFVWCEVPCVACLRTIRRDSEISTIYCLTIESYGTTYPAVLLADRVKEHKNRRTLAANLGIEVIELDLKEIQEHELYRNGSLDIEVELLKSNQA